MALMMSITGWVYVRNRKEKLISSKESLGVKCDWDLTSRLHINLIFPLLGKRLFRKAFNDFPIKFSTPGFKKSLQSKISFIIGHRGDQRLPLLLTVLKSIAAQQGCEIECVVVEQDSQERIKEFLPDWVTYVHSPQSKENMPYSRSGAFNVGAEFAKSDFFIFHDNDILVPEVYAREMWNSYQAGFEVVNLKRFIFFLDEKATQKVCVTKNFDEIPDIQYILKSDIPCYIQGLLWSLIRAYLNICYFSLFLVYNFCSVFMKIFNSLFYRLVENGFVFF